jgi:hypothetical protein
MRWDLWVGATASRHSVLMHCLCAEQSDHTLASFLCPGDCETTSGVKRQCSLHLGFRRTESVPSLPSKDSIPSPIAGRLTFLSHQSARVSQRPNPMLNLIVIRGRSQCVLTGRYFSGKRCALRAHVCCAAVLHADGLAVQPSTTSAGRVH